MLLRNHILYPSCLFSLLLSLKKKKILSFFPLFKFPIPSLPHSHSQLTIFLLHQETETEGIFHRFLQLHLTTYLLLLSSIQLLEMFSLLLSKANPSGRSHLFSLPLEYHFSNSLVSFLINFSFLLNHFYHHSNIVLLLPYERNLFMTPLSLPATTLISLTIPFCRKFLERFAYSSFSQFLISLFLINPL